MNISFLTIKNFRLIQNGIFDFINLQLKIEVIKIHNSCYILMTSLRFFVYLRVIMFMTQIDHRTFSFSKFGNARPILFPSRLKLGLSKIAGSKTEVKIPKIPTQ